MADEARALMEVEHLRADLTRIEQRAGTSQPTSTPTEQSMVYIVLVFSLC